MKYSYILSAIVFVLQSCGTIQPMKKQAPGMYWASTPKEKPQVKLLKGFRDTLFVYYKDSSYKKVIPNQYQNTVVRFNTIFFSDHNKVGIGRKDELYFIIFNLKNKSFNLIKKNKNYVGIGPH